MHFFKPLVSFLSDKGYRSLLYTTSIVLAIGTVMYHYLEDWSWIDSLYFSVITLSTIGYGDFSPQTDLGKVFTIIYIIIGIGIILNFINTLHNHYSESRKDQKLTKNDL